MGADREPRPDAPGRAPLRFRGCPRLEVPGGPAVLAATPIARTLGLALLDRERAPERLLIPRCRSIHTFGMRFTIDVCFLDRRGVVIAERRALGPGRIAFEPGASAVLERRAA